ncbi:MAG: outer membrane protein [Pararhodobacter sp.]
MKRIILAAALTSFGGTAAFAGSLTTTPAEPPVMAPSAPAPSPAYNWSGGYVGTGLTFGRALHSTNTSPQFWPNGSGVGIGGFAGYNWQQGNTVFGVEGHLSGHRMRGSTDLGGATGEIRTDLRALASIRARAGVAADRTLFFVTGGAAGGSVRHTGVDLGIEETNRVTGVVLGVGVEHALADGIHIRGDLEHYRFGSRDFDTAGPGSFPGVRSRANVARVSAVFRF